MIKILKHFKGHGLAVFIILLLTVVQVYCDLALPQYTSDLVDVGIQQNGIEDAVPQYLSEETCDYLALFMEEGDISLLDENYSQKPESDESVSGDCLVYTGEAKGEDREKLRKAMQLPMAIVYMSSQTEEFDLKELKTAVDMGMVTREQLLDGIEGEMDNYISDNDYSESLLSQAAVAGVAAEYEKLGVDLRAVQLSYLWREGFIMLILTVVMIMVAIAAGFFSSRTAAQIGRDTRRRVFSKVLSFSNGEMDKFSTASLITRCTNDVQQIQNVSVMLLRIVMMAPIMGAGAIIKVVSTHTGMGWITVIAVLMMMILMGLLLIVAMPKFKIMQKLIDKVNLVSREIISGIPVIRAFSREDFEENRFNSASQDLRATQIFTQRTMSVMVPAMMMIMNLIAVGIVWFGAHGVDLGDLQVGDMMAFITYTIQVVISFMMLSVAAIIVPRAAVAAGRIEEVTETQLSIEDRENAITVDAESAEGRVTFDHVSFRYPGAEEDVLKDVTFEALPGQTTAIIGSTGSGKTTLIDMIPRFHDVTEGAVRIDGTDVRDIKLKALRNLIGYVPQKGVLFSGDISSNIRFASPDITDEEMKRAADIAQATEFIEERPEGFAREVSQGGTNVSGGQKQRLSIARAIAKNPKIYIFDDSFSALDYKTDSKLRHRLAESTSDATVIIVAQRIATILHADRIVVLEDGEVVGLGTHETLLESCDVYKEIAVSQLSEEELRKGAK